MFSYNLIHKEHLFTFKFIELYAALFYEVLFGGELENYEQLKFYILAPPPPFL